MASGQEEQVEAGVVEVQNKQVLFRDFVTGYPKESDMVLSSGKIQLKLPEGSKAVLLKNLYLSCDPFMRHRMRPDGAGYIDPFTPGSVIPSSFWFYFNIPKSVLDTFLCFYQLKCAQGIHVPTIQTGLRS